MGQEPLVDAEFSRELMELIEANRSRALWYFAKDFVPATPDSARRVLEAIAARGDRATWVRARQLLRRLA